LCCAGFFVLVVAVGGVGGGGGSCHMVLHKNEHVYGCYNNDVGAAYKKLDISVHRIQFKEFYLLFICSECPQELFEPVSGLIFAAARFADLPELFVLRHIFTMRFGRSLESFVNSEVIKLLFLFMCLS